MTVETHAMRKSTWSPGWFKGVCRVWFDRSACLFYEARYWCEPAIFGGGLRNFSVCSPVRSGSWWSSAALAYRQPDPDPFESPGHYFLNSERFFLALDLYDVRLKCRSENAYLASWMPSHSKEVQCDAYTFGNIHEMKVECEPDF